MSSISKKRVHLYLIKPSSYDDDGYVVRYFRGVLPSNTLACLAALTERTRERGILPGLDLRTHLIDETVARVDVRKIARNNRGPNKAIVCLVGVQTSQFPRAGDLAREFRKAGVTVLIGGFHVSGLLNTVPEIPAQMQELLDCGVCLVKGEVEEAWDDLLKDAVLDRLNPLYDFTEAKPDLQHAPVPLVDRKYMKRFASSDFGTVDCGRGCPYKCSFCTIINVQGQKMRFRSPEAIELAIRENYRTRKVWFYFFTDDNFARNKNWEKIFDALIRLREDEGIPVSFMMQVDTQSHKIARFIDKAARAGCSNVFIGMESINEENLKATGKNQNNVDDYRYLIEAYRTAGIVTHAGYIVGFPHDTPESVQADLDRLMNEVQVDMASFFILTPLPGSRDYVRYLSEGVDLDPDFNNYDSFHQTMPHTGFPEKGSLVKTSHHAWNTFYNRRNMARVLNRCGEKRYWQLFRNFIWYKTAIVVERRHPMMAGFMRLKGRKQVRPGVAPLSRFKYLKTRAKELKVIPVGPFGGVPRDADVVARDPQTVRTGEADQDRDCPAEGAEDSPERRSESVRRGKGFAAQRHRALQDETVLPEMEPVYLVRSVLSSGGSPRFLEEDLRGAQ